MATTTNYGWTTPDNTAYVKDGASAIRTLATSIDTTSAGANLAGLVLVKSQTIGTSVNAVTVSSAFSSTYDSYKIIVTGGAGSGTQFLSLTIGAAATQYRYSLVYATYATATPLAAVATNAASYVYAGVTNTTGIFCDLDIHSPFLTKNTQFRSVYNSSNEAGQSQGYLNDTSSYTSFTLTASGASTMTGGVVYVYGYRKAI